MSLPRPQSEGRRNGSTAEGRARDSRPDGLAASCKKQRLLPPSSTDRSGHRSQWALVLITVLGSALASIPEAG